MSDLADLCDVQPFTFFYEDANKLDFHKQNLNFGHININSILHGNRLDQLQSILHNGSFSAFAVSETKLSPNISDNCISIPGYSVIRKDRNCHGGGLCLFMRQDICFRRLPHLESEIFEHICVEAFISGKRILFNACYRPPREDFMSHNSFLQSLESTLENLKQNNPFFCLLAGDMNLGNIFSFYDLPKRSLDEKAKNIFDSFNLTEIIDVGTRYSQQCVSLLDLIFIDRPDFVDKAGVIPQIADHMGCIISLKITSKPPKPRFKETFLFEQVTREKWAEFKTYLLNFKIDQNSNSNEHCESLTNYLKEGMNRFVPKIKFKEKVNNIPWESSVTRRLMVKKNRKYKLYRTSVNQLKTLRVDDPNFYNVSTRVSLNFQKFRTASDEYKKVTRREKNRYLHTLKSVWSNPDIPTRKKFSILKKLSKSEKSNYIPPLIENNETIHESEKKANIFNDFFASKSQVPNPQDEPPDLPKINTNDVLENLNTSPFELGPLIKALKNSNFSPCGVPSNFLKTAYSFTGSVLTNLLCDLLNKIFYSGEFPDTWKLAHVTPIFKSNDKCNKSNYRPISILSTLSKLTEAVIHKRLLNHLLTNNIITKYQAAYIPADSTSQQLLSIIHQIKSAWANDDIAQAVFLDITKAFDSVWHRGLLKKLEQINIKGSALQLFSSYLSNRKIVTVVDGEKSIELPINAGVPQGSRLGPLLFILFINDLVVDLESTPYLYADDTTLIATAKNTTETTNKLNRDLVKITNWAHIWKVEFNPAKSKDMIFSKALLPSFPTMMGDYCIERVHLHKHLGIFLSSDLTWDRQIANITKKVNLKLSILNKVKGLSRQCLDVLYKLHIRSTIDYGISVFGPSLCNKQIDILDNLQYKAGKIVTGALKFTSKENLQRELGWENTRKRIEFICLSQFRKIVHWETTPLIRECLPPLLNQRYPTNRTFEHYPDKKRVLENSYFPYVIKRWDTLPLNVRSLDQPDFKLKLKELLKPIRYKHFNCGYRFPNTLLSQLRLKRSNLNAHLHPIGLSGSPDCLCGKTETVRHFLLECNLYTQPRLHLFEKLEGLLEKRLKHYSKADLLDILLFGEKPHLPEKYTHNKFISYAVQNFLLKTKRLVFNSRNKHQPKTQPINQNET